MAKKQFRPPSSRGHSGRGKRALVGQMSLPFPSGCNVESSSGAKRAAAKRGRKRRKKGRGRGRIRPVRIVKVRSFHSRVLGRRVSAREIGLPVLTFVFDDNDPNCGVFAEFITNKKQ